jgi:hypothetical protein
MREFPAMETHILDKSLDAQLHVPTFDGPLGRAIIETHIWAVHEGLSGATARDLFDGYCQRLVVHGVPLWRAHTAMETLHPQWLHMAARPECHPARAIRAQRDHWARLAK